MGALRFHRAGQSRHVTLYVGIALAILGLLQLVQPASGQQTNGLAWGLILYGVLRAIQALSMIASGVDDIEKGELARSTLPGWAKAMIAFSTHHTVNLGVGAVMLVAGISSIVQGAESAVQGVGQGLHGVAAVAYGLFRLATSLGTLKSGRAHLRGGALDVPRGEQPATSADTEGGRANRSGRASR